MKSKFITATIYFISIILTTIIFIWLGTELITQYTIHTSGYTGIERHYLADDMGFGMLLIFGLIPEIILGIISGTFIGKKLNVNIENT